MIRRICGCLERYRRRNPDRLVVPVLAARFRGDSVMVGEVHIRLEGADDVDKSCQDLILTAPHRKGFFRGLGISEIREAEKMYFGALNLCGFQRLFRPKGSKIFIELGTDLILTSFTSGKENTVCLNVMKFC